MSFKDWTIPQLTRGYEAGQFSPLEVAADAFSRAGEAAEYNAFVYLDPETAFAQAKESERRWVSGKPLSDIDGIPATIKDLHHVAGWKTFAGSSTCSSDEKNPARQDSPLVARLREAGCVFLGKTTVPEFGWKGVTDSPLTGLTRNPWDKSKVSGGSSGGAAVAAALGIGRIHTGSDGGGSIRIPSAFCGVVGLKPSFGAVPQFPLVSTMSSHAPITATVREAAISLRHAGKHDPRDWLATSSNVFQSPASGEKKTSENWCMCRRPWPRAKRRRSPGCRRSGNNPGRIERVDHPGDAPGDFRRSSPADRDFLGPRQRYGLGPHPRRQAPPPRSWFGGDGAIGTAPFGRRNGECRLSTCRPGQFDKCFPQQLRCPVDACDAVRCLRRRPGLPG